jgi:hypothetical protein
LIAYNNGGFNVITLLIYILSAIILLLLFYLVKKLYDRTISFNKLIADGKFQLLVNLVVIIVMLITIREGQSDMDQTISAFKAEGSRQIEAYGKEASRQIEAFGKEATRQISANVKATIAAIKAMRSVENGSNKTGKTEELLILAREVERNAEMINHVLDAESDAEIVSGKNTISGIFSLNAYEQGYALKHISDKYLLNILAEFYQAIGRANVLLEAAKNMSIAPVANVQDKYIVVGNRQKEAIEICKNQKKNAQIIIGMLKNKSQ